MTEKLSEYRRKRDPEATPEPFTGAKRRAKKPVFVVQRHDARRLHYDFRLERDGALASWAVPKGVPLEPGQQHLAVHVEDHPLEYAAFEGEIPAGNYGAGTVEIWDRGTWELLEEKRDGGLTFRLRGEKLDGEWTLIKFRRGKDEWLLLKTGASVEPVSRERDGQSGSHRWPGKRCYGRLAQRIEHAANALMPLLHEAQALVRTLVGCSHLCSRG